MEKNTIPCIKLNSNKYINKIALYTLLYFLTLSLNRCYLIVVIKSLLLNRCH